MAGNAQQTRAAVSGRAAAGVFFPAFENDGRNGAERFDVINDRRAAVEADDRREGRLDARIAALAFERLHQRGFFAAFVGARAGVHDQIKIEPRAEDIVAEVVVRIRFVESGLDDVEDVAILASDVDEAFRRANRASRNDDAFDHLVRVHLHQRTVLAGAGLGFIGIADDVFRLRRILGDERPLHARGKARAAAPAQVGLLHFVDDGLRRHFFERFFQRLITVVLQKHIELVGKPDAEAAADDRSLRRIARVQGARGDRFRSWMSPSVEFFDDAIELHGREIFVEVVVDLHGRRAGASADAFDFFERENAVAGGFFVADFQALLGLVEQLIAATQHARVLAHRLAAEHGVIGQRLFHCHRSQVQPPRDFRNHFVADVAIFILRVHHHGDERAALERVAVLQRVEAGGELLREFHGPGVRLAKDC